MIGEIAPMNPITGVPPRLDGNGFGTDMTHKADVSVETRFRRATTRRVVEKRLQGRDVRILSGGGRWLAQGFDGGGAQEPRPHLPKQRVRGIYIGTLQLSIDCHGEPDDIRRRLANQMQGIEVTRKTLDRKSVV